MFTLNDTSTVRMQMTAAMQAEMTAIVNEWYNIKGDYERTLLGGVWHYKCDSGILTDAFGADDRRVVDEKLAHLLDEDGDETDEWYEAVHNMDELCFNEVLAAITAICDKYDVYDEDVARELRFMEMDVNGE